MKTRRFVVYSIIYVILLAALVYVLDAREYTLKVLEYNISLPIAIWFAVPVGIFALFAIFHILFHGMEFYGYKRAIKKDTASFKDFVKEIFLGLPSNKDFRTNIYDLSSVVVKILSPLNQYKDLEPEDNELSNILASIRNIQSGEVADLKKYKLPKDNSLYIQNELNKIENLNSYYIDILKSDSCNENLNIAAYKKLIKVGTYSEIKRYVVGGVTDKNDILLIVKRFIDDEIELSDNEMYDLLNTSEISSCEFVKIAVSLKDKLKPEVLKSLFEKIKIEHSSCDEAYMYVLYELVMIDELRENLQNSDEDDYIALKTLLYLKDGGKKAPSSIFFNDRL